MKLEFEPIGIINTPFTNLEGMPIQPTGAQGVKGSVKVFNDYLEGLNDLDEFSHIILLYFFHQSDGYRMSVIPYMDTVPRGLFATRAPKRPNPIGLSVVQLDKIIGNTLYIQNIDVLDGTPLLDIKPYVPDFETATDVRLGWLQDARKTVASKRADDRFK